MEGENEKKRTSYSFLQIRFEEMTTEDRADYFHHGDEHKVSGKTNLLERFTSSFIFAQLSAKQGIKKCGREAEL
jgi:hypothetical protein